MWLEVKKKSEWDINTNITVLSNVWNIKDDINNSALSVINTNSCKWYCNNNDINTEWNRENCWRSEGCRNSENYDDWLNIQYKI
jgi:hypothetical protein